MRNKRNTIEKFEPRVNIIDIVLNDNSEKNAVDIEITFNVNNVSQPITVNTTITRAR